MPITTQPLDIVIAWVDGNDPVLKEKRLQFQSNKQPSSAVSATRFASNQEIYYNVASILKYVPFCRHIYIVSDQQRPEFIDEFVQQQLCDADKIKIVDHREIFAGYTQYLPTFNTRSIESMLWNIPGLSDYFIYLNDDFFFNQAVQLSDFLAHQQMVIHGHWRSCLPHKLKLVYRKLLNQKLGKVLQPKHLTAQMLSADILGFKRFFEIHHYPHIVDRQLLKNYLLSKPELLIKQIQYKFRDVAQLNPISLNNHLKIKAKQACLKPDLAIAYLSQRKNLERFFKDLSDSNVQYGCIQSLDLFNASQQQQIHQAMRIKFAGFLPASVAGT